MAWDGIDSNDFGPNGEFVVWPENALAVRVFTELEQSCWVFSEYTGHPRGLRVEALDVIVRYESEDEQQRKQLFEDLRLMGKVATSVIVKQLAEKNGG